jgi:3-oxoacyl-[acyl-carrier-protein] synthase III
VTRSIVLGTGSYTPRRVLTNLDLEAMVDTTDAWIQQRTGIRERRIASPQEATSDMAIAAARAALERAQIAPGDLDMIIVGTVSPDMPTPSCAALVQAALSARSAFAFDISAACAGSLYGISIADQFIRTGSARYVLVIGAELLSRLVDWTDRETCILFGDAAGALVLGPTQDENRGLLSVHLSTDGTAAEILSIPAGGSRRPASSETLAARMHSVSMKGRDVYRFAVRVLPEALTAALETNCVAPEDVAHVVCHQANMRIVESVLAKVGIPLERCWVNLDRYGNTSSASLPLSLDEADRSGRLKRGDLVAMMAIGAGMAWGSALMRW